MFFLGLALVFVSAICGAAVFRVHALTREVGTLGLTKKELDDAMLSAIAELGGPVDRDIASARVSKDEGALTLALIDADRATDAYPRLPRILASVSSSGSLLLAAGSLRAALRQAEEISWETLTIPLTIVSSGIFGTIFCLSLQREYARLRREVREEVDRLAGI